MLEVSQSDPSAACRRGHPSRHLAVVPRGRRARQPDLDRHRRTCGHLAGGVGPRPPDLTSSDTDGGHCRYLKNARIAWSNWPAAVLVLKLMTSSMLKLSSAASEVMRKAAQG